MSNMLAVIRRAFGSAMYWAIMSATMCWQTDWWDLRCSIHIDVPDSATTGAFAVVCVVIQSSDTNNVIS